MAEAAIVDNGGEGSIADGGAVAVAVVTTTTSSFFEMDETDGLTAIFVSDSLKIMF